MPFWSRKACKWLRTTASVSDGLMSMVDLLLFEVSVNKSAETRPQRPQVRAQDLQDRSDDGAPRIVTVASGGLQYVASCAAAPHQESPTIDHVSLIGRSTGARP